MSPQDVVSEFIRSVDNSRRFGNVLHRSIKAPREKPQRVFLLVDLLETGRARLKDIASRTGQSPQNLCILYNGFEKEGLVAREVDPDDRRSTYYSITPKGERLVAKHKNAAMEAIEKVFKELSGHDLDELRASLTKTNEIIEKVLKRMP